MSAFRRRNRRIPPVDGLAGGADSLLRTRLRGQFPANWEIFRDLARFATRYLGPDGTDVTKARAFLSPAVSHRPRINREYWVSYHGKLGTVTANTLCGERHTCSSASSRGSSTRESGNNLPVKALASALTEVMRTSACMDVRETAGQSDRVYRATATSSLAAGARAPCLAESMEMDSKSVRWENR
jgi:hypothetical protein